MTQKELADKVGATIGTISEIETGKRKRPHNLKRILEALGMNAEAKPQAAPLDVLTLIVRDHKGRSIILGELRPETGALKMLYDDIDDKAVKMAKSIESQAPPAPAPSTPAPEPQQIPSGVGPAKDATPPKSPTPHDPPAHHKHRPHRPKADGGSR